jgi:hypothetical protein
VNERRQKRKGFVRPRQSIKYWYGLVRVHWWGQRHPRSPLRGQERYKNNKVIGKK